LKKIDKEYLGEKLENVILGILSYIDGKIDKIYLDSENKEDYERKVRKL
jgi:hypothetical protein